jgi:peptidoglycan/xylan/chitin deacetylase (PgdA/CDA1 family)
MIRSQPFTILLFHSVSRPQEAQFLPSSLNCPPDVFENLLQLLREEASIVPLRQIVLQTAPEHAVALTFDDGFRDNFTAAWPLLQKHGVPATLFVATDAVGASALLPIHKFYYLKQQERFAPPPDLDIDSPARRQFVDGFCTTRGIKIPLLGGKLYASWDELRAMADGGIEIGAHTCSHPWLVALSADEQQREIFGSKQVLEEQLGRAVTSFAYPYGYRHSFDASAAAIVAGNFESAVLSVSESDGAFDAQRLPRCNIASFYEP